MWWLLVIPSLFLIFLVYASFCIRSGVFLRAFCGSRTARKVVALTFDDGPDPVHTPEVLEVLKAYEVSASFFCAGNKIPGQEELIRTMHHEGHLVGNHSYSHSWSFPFFPFEKMKTDVAACGAALEQVLSQPVPWFRPPFGVTNPVVARVVRTLGLKTIGWNIRSLDTLIQSRERLVARMVRNLRPGAVILMHDRMPHCAGVVRDLLEALRARGYQVVRVDELYNNLS